MVENGRPISSGGVGSRRRRAESREGGLVFQDIDEVVVSLTTMRLASSLRAGELSARGKVKRSTERTRWQLMKHSEVSSITKRARMPPLFPCLPPMPVLTVILATSRRLADSDDLTKMQLKSCE